MISRIAILGFVLMVVCPTVFAAVNCTLTPADLSCPPMSCTSGGCPCGGSAGQSVCQRAGSASIDFCRSYVDESRSYCMPSNIQENIRFQYVDLVLFSNWSAANQAIGYCGDFNFACLQCMDKYKNFLCTKYFRECTPSSTPGVSYLKPVCTSACTNFNDACGPRSTVTSYLARGGSTFPTTSCVNDSRIQESYMDGIPNGFLGVCNASSGIGFGYTLLGFLVVATLALVAGTA